MSSPEPGSLDVWLVNADPLTGEPAVLGEVYPAAVAAAPGSRPETPGTALDELRAVRPGLHRLCTRVAAGQQLPCEVLIRAIDGGPGVVLRVAPLALTPEAALRFLGDRLDRGAIDAPTALRRLPPAALARRPADVDPARNPGLIRATRGEPIAGAPATGVLVPGRVAQPGEPRAGGPTIMLVERVEGSHTQLLDDPDCAGVLALRGSPVDHFALMSRDRGFGYMALPEHRVDDTGLHWDGGELRFGTAVTVDFATGEVYAGTAALDAPRAADPRQATIERLLVENRGPALIRVNVDTADDLPGVLPATADGIGLVRTEHLVRRSRADDLLRAALSAGPGAEAQSDFDTLGGVLETQLRRLLRAAAGRPVTVRLLDYPLHELGGPVAGEVNPMLGLRGVRQGVRWPALYRTQLQAILRASAGVRQSSEHAVPVEVLVPLVVTSAEVALVRTWWNESRDQVQDAGTDLRLGAMVETPAAAMSVESLAGECDVLSFGTNDLTQLLLGLSREDYLPVLDAYRTTGLAEDDPFVVPSTCVLDLVRDAARRARARNPEVTIGFCGAHAVDPRVVSLAVQGLVDHVSVPLHALSPTRLRAFQVAGDESTPALETAGGPTW
ncbi:putative PEP-binding protein [Geodermatophilus sp. SYSU D00697]